MKGGTVVMENTTEKKSIGRFSILDEETFDAAENSEYWVTINREKLKTRKYYPETFSDKFSKIYYWAGHNLHKGRTAYQRGYLSTFLSKSGDETVSAFSFSER